MMWEKLKTRLYLCFFQKWEQHTCFSSGRGTQMLCFEGGHPSWKTESIIRSLGVAKLLRSKLARGGSWRYLCSPLRFLGSLAAGATVMVNYTASEPSICTSCCPDKIFLVQYLQRVRRCPSELHLIEIKLSLERKEESQLKISFQTYFVF